MITGISEYLNNIEDDCNLLAVHSPLKFICSVTYDVSMSPVYVNIYDENNNLLNTFQALLYSDDNVGNAKVYFIADSILKTYMGSISDTLQPESELVYQPNMTKIFRIEFSDVLPTYVGDSLAISINIIGYLGSVQFGENPALIDIFNNAAQVYTGAKYQTIYVYFFNDSITNSLSISGVTPSLFYARDDDNAIFTDDDDAKFYIEQF